MRSAWLQRIGILFLVLFVVAAIPLVAITIWLGTPRSAIILLQNHHELRATGGFLGSVLVITGSVHEPIRWKTHDIYSLAGQNTYTIEAPPGYREYLSGGKPLQLADANWWPDIPYTANTLSSMLQSAGLPEPDAIVFLNTQTVQALLEVMGPLFVPDFQTEVTSQNVFQVINNVRGEFFPGSNAKANVLQHLVTQCFYLIKHEGIAQLPTLWKFAHEEQSRGNIYLWSPHWAAQQLSRMLHLTGEMVVAESKQPTTLYMYPVESNVGVNKANAGITRDITVKAIDDTTSVLEITWHNTNPLNPSERPELVRLVGAAGADHTHYANYFRIFTLPHTTISQVESDDADLTTQHQSTFVTESGQIFNQFGILVPVLAQSDTTVSFTLRHPSRNSLTSIQLIHQAGLTDSTYQFKWPGQTVPLTPFRSTVSWQPRVQ